MATKKKAAAKTSTSTALVNVDAEMQAEMEKIQGRIAAVTGNTISTKGKIFRLPDGSSLEGPLNVVVVDWALVNKFYPGKFKESDPTPPACFAAAASIAELVPSTQSPDRQADECASCPNNEFGSDGDGKACKNTYLLAVLPEDADENAEIALLSVPPTSMKAFSAYTNTLKRVGNALPIKVVTEVSFDPEKDYVVLQFRALDPNKRYKEHWQRRGEAQALLLSEPDWSRASAKPKSKPSRRRAA